MIKWLKCIIALAAVLAVQPAFAALNILACEPEWGALAKELGGDKVSIYVATNAMQDPHHIQARPSLMARARNADLVVCTGAELEIGWLPLLQTQSGNPKIQTGQPGYFEASRYVAKLEVPQRVDRAQGDVHPGGNPHIQLSPYNIEKVAAALAERMAQLDSGDAAYYQARTKAFLDRWQQAITKWEKEAAPLKGMTIVAYHKNLSYLNAWLGMQGNRGTGAQARAAADDRASERAAGAACQDSGKGGRERRVQRFAGGRVAGRARQNPRRDRALHGRRHRQGAGSVQPL